MTQTHYLPVPLSYGRGTQALWALNPSGHVVIFVHGFAGKAIETWLDFPFLLPQLPEAARCDFVFYGYDGKHTRSTVSAVELREFIDALYREPVDVINASLPEGNRRANSFKYTRFDMVAHSLGAVVSREALLHGYKSKKAWAPLTHLILFAPAHTGTNILVLIKETFFFWPFIKLASTVQLLGRYTVLQDLHPGCQTLTSLFNETQRLLDAGEAPTLVARSVTLAAQDNVVHPTTFAEDPPPEVFRDTGHINVCKPRGSFLEPLETVRGEL